MNTALLIILILYILTQLADFALEFLNLRYLKKHGNEIPEEFAGVVSPETMRKSTAYTFAKSKFSMINRIYTQLITLVFIFAGILNWYNNLLFGYQERMNWPFVIWGLIFVMLLSYAKTILNTPFNYYQTFGLERRFGFNTMTTRLWFNDLVKGVLVSTVIISILLLGAFWLIDNLRDIWWLPVWGFFFVFTFFIIYISPYVLEPLFNKFTPIDDRELAKDIIEMLKQAGIKVKGVYKMDASRRTRHSNAYFSGLGRVKRIVIFDTLLEKLSHDELMAVLAHEAGHCRKGHVIKNLILFEILTAIGAFIAYEVLEHTWLTQVFGLSQDTFFAKMVLFSFVASIVIWAMPLIFNTISRHFERQADDFAVKVLGTGKSLAAALVKLSADNLSNIHPQKLYARFHYSHPPEVERIRRLNAAEADK
ncbi:M48 family metallopeptidase [Lentisphaerota bacterium ZTH]|nr:M48 family metallopeptidase [Lentisphaerota bacterium]WET07363.1 M48 family metallopeptidase [Lentisphaerota bacterium ZTH]